MADNFGQSVASTLQSVFTPPPAPAKVTTTTPIQNMSVAPMSVAPTPPAPPKPTSVVSSNTAATTASNIQSNVIAPYDQASTQKAQALYDTATGYVTPYGLSQGAKPVQPNDPAMAVTGSTTTSSNTNSGSSSTTGSSSTLEDAQTNSVLHPNQTQLYNLSNGQQEWVDDSKISNGTAVGYSANNPTSMGAVATVDGANGETYKQFSDGTYGMFDAAGNYVTAANSAQFQAAKEVSDANTAFDNAKNGIYTPTQQVQIDAMNSQYQALMDKQTTINNNTTGATSIAENRYGLGNQTIGQQAITKTVTDGLQAIATLTSQRDASIAQMKSGFETDDMNAVKSAFDNYNTSSQNIQKNLDKVQAAIQDTAAKQQTSDESFATTMAGKYGDTTTPIDPYNDDKNTVLEKLKTSQKYQADQAVSASLTPDESNFMGQLATSGVSLSNMFPSLGIGAAAAGIKVGIIKSMIDNAQKTGLSAQEMADSMLDKQSKAKTYTKLQQQGSLLSSQETKVESDFDLVKSLGSKVSDASLQGAAPILQNWINTGTLATTNNPDLNNWLGALTTSMTNYARVVYGQTGTAGVSAGANTEVQDLLKKGLSVNTVNSYIDNVAKPEMKNTISGYDTSMKQLMSDMNNADGTVNASGGLGATTNNLDPAGLGV